MTSNNTNEAPEVSQAVITALLREEVYSPDFLAWLTDKLFNTLEARLKASGVSQNVTEALDILQVLHMLHSQTLQGRGEGFRGASEYVAQATRFIDQLGGDFYKEV